MDNYNLSWFFKETIYGKSIYIDLNNVNTHISSGNINFSNIERDYKKYFIHRINLIMNCINENYKDTTYNTIVYNYNKLIEKNVVNFEEYKNIRNKFEKYN